MTTSKTNPKLPEYDHSETDEHGVTTYTKGGAVVMTSKPEGQNQVISIVNDGKTSAEYYVGKDSVVAPGLIVDNTIQSGATVRPFRRVEYSTAADGSTTSTTYGYQSNGQDGQTTNYRVRDETITHPNGTAHKTVHDTYGAKFPDGGAIAHSAFTQTITADYGADGKPTHAEYSVSGSDGKPVHSISVTTNEDGTKTAHIKKTPYEYDATIAADGKITELTPVNDAAKGLLANTNEAGASKLKQELGGEVHKVEDAAIKAHDQKDPNENVFGDVPPLYDADIHATAGDLQHETTPPTPNVTQINPLSNQTPILPELATNDPAPTPTNPDLAPGFIDTILAHPKNTLPPALHPLSPNPATYTQINREIAELLQKRTPRATDDRPLLLENPATRQSTLVDYVVSHFGNESDNKPPTGTTPQPADDSLLAKYAQSHADGSAHIEFPAYKPEDRLPITRDSNSHAPLTINPDAVAAFLKEAGHNHDGINSALETLSQPSENLTVHNAKKNGLEGQMMV